MTLLEYRRALLYIPNSWFEDLSNPVVTPTPYTWLKLTKTPFEFLTALKQAITYEDGKPLFKHLVNVYGMNIRKLIADTITVSDQILSDTSKAMFDDRLTQVSQAKDTELPMLLQNAFNRLKNNLPGEGSRTKEAVDTWYAKYNKYATNLQTTVDKLNVGTNNFIITDTRLHSYKWYYQLDGFNNLLSFLENNCDTYSINNYIAIANSLDELLFYTIDKLYGINYSRHTEELLAIKNTEDPMRDILNSIKCMIHAFELWLESINEWSNGKALIIYTSENSM